MKRIIYYLVVFSCVVGWYSCKEGNVIYYLDSSAPAPEQVSNLKVVSTPGGAVITYDIPKDKNLAYVKAVYEIQTGVFREAKSSYYRDTLDLIGFGDTLIHKVEIYSIGRNEKASEPVSVDVKPLTPPVESVFETVTFDATFGGVIVTFNNNFQADLAIVVMADTTEQHSWVPVKTYYTAAADGYFTVRGFEPEEYKFAIYIRDRWNNKSDTLIKMLTPLYEELIPKSPFKALHLPGDFWAPTKSSLPLENLWDDIINVSGNVFASKDYLTLPQWFTVDLGQTIIFSRVKFFQRTPLPYNSIWVKSFEVWGTNSYDPGGSWDNWERLGKFDSRIPSCSVWPDYTSDDMVYQKAGEDFTFTQPLTAVRYIRFKILDTYGGQAQYQFSEFTFWGQIIK